MVDIELEEMSDHQYRELGKWLAEEVLADYKYLELGKWLAEVLALADHKSMKETVRKKIAVERENKLYKQENEKMWNDIEALKKQNLIELEKEGVKHKEEIAKLKRENIELRLVNNELMAVRKKCCN